MCLVRSVHGLGHLVRSGLVRRREDVPVRVGRDDVEGVTGPDFLAADDEGNIDDPGRLRFQLGFQLGSFRRPWSVGENRTPQAGTLASLDPPGMCAWT